jgi:hypothetical protein
MHGGCQLEKEAINIELQNSHPVPKVIGTVDKTSGRELSLSNTNDVPITAFIMPSVPFSPSNSPSSSPKTSPSPPSIVLHPASGILDHSD